MTGRPLCAELPATVDSYSFALNEPGAAEVTVHDPADGTDVRALVRTRRTALWIWRDSVPVWSGIIWNNDPDIAGHTVKLSAQSMSSYLARRRIFVTLDFRQAEQLDIARRLIEVGLDDSGGVPIHIDRTTPPSGRLRDRTYAYHEFKPVLEAVTQLAQVIDGFEFTDTTSVHPDTGRPVSTLQLGYPTIGRPTPSGLLLHHPGNVHDYTWPLDGADSVNRMFTVGATLEGQELPITAQAADTAERLAGYPLLEESKSYTDVSILDTLNGHAQAELAAALGDRTAVTLTLRGDELPHGELLLGDVVRLQLASWWHPPTPTGAPTLDRPVRITAVTVKPDHHHGDTIELTCADMPN